jgi:hypothetical protein
MSFASAFCSGFVNSTVYATSNSGTYYRLSCPSSRSDDDLLEYCVDVSRNCRVGEVTSLGLSDNYYVFCNVR